MLREARLFVQATELGCDPVNLGVFQLMEQRHHATLKKGPDSDDYQESLLHFYFRNSSVPKGNLVLLDTHSRKPVLL